MVLLATTLAGSWGEVAAQERSVATGEMVALSLRDAPVRQALEDLIRVTALDLVYSSDVVDGRTTVCRMESADAEALLRCVVQGAGLDFYRLSSGTYVIIASREELPAYGTLSGQIVDAVTGEPLPSVQVELLDGSRRTLTNGAGLFLLTRLLPGPHQVLFSRSGYRPQRLPLEIFTATNLRRRVRLDPAVMELDPLVVEGIREVGPGPASDATWRSEGFDGGVPRDGEISQEARTGLGVSRRPLFADLSIQGSAPGEHLVRLDGVPVFDPVSLGRARSAFSPLALRRITVRKAGFGAEHGSFVGGVIDVEQALTNPTGPGGVTALADPYSVNGNLSLPVGVLGGEGALMVAGRTSLWSLYQEPSLERALRGWNQVDPILMDQLSLGGSRFSTLYDEVPENDGSSVGFTDIHAALRLEFPGFRSLRASFYRGTNDVGTDLLVTGVWTPPGAGATAGPSQLYLMRDHYAWSNTVGQLRGDWLVGDRASLQLRGWATRHILDHDYGVVQPPAGAVTPDELRQDVGDGSVPEDGNRIQEWGVSGHADLAAGWGHFLTAGTEVAWLRSQTYLQNRFLRPLVSESESWRVTGFVQDRWRVSSDVTVEGGIRVTSVAGQGPWAEPRISARMDGRNDVLGDWSIQVGAGLYRQYLNQFSLTNVGPSALVPEVQFWLPVDETLEPARARHLSGELAFRPWTGWELRAEGYYKAMDRILALDYRTLTTSTSRPDGGLVLGDFIGAAEGVAYGAGVRAGWEGGRARFALGYDWNVSERTFPSRFDGARQPTPWSEPHRVTVQGRLPLWAGLALDADARGVWGRSWALRRAYYDYLSVVSPDGTLPVGLPGDDALPTLYGLDVGLAWLGELGGTLTEIRAELRNAQWDRQVLDYSLVPLGTGADATWERRERLLPGPALLISARVGF